MNHRATPPLPRRHFLRTTLASGAATLAGGFSPATLQGKEPDHEICVFNKPLQHLSYEQQAELVAELGFAGIEGTVRKGGHVEPESVERDLPRQIEALRRNGLEMTLMTTDVNAAEPEIHRRVLTSAAKLGVKRFRMGSIPYSPDRPLPEQLDEIRKTFHQLVSFCRPLGIQPLYQNHAGANRFGAGLWDLYLVLRDIDPADAGVAFDIRHATVEGGQSWPTEFQLLSPHFGVVYCKDFIWEAGKPRPRNVPLGTGRVHYPAFFSLLRKSEFRGPVSLHMEYKNHRDPKLLEESIEAIREDRKSLLALLQG